MALNSLKIPTWYSEAVNRRRAENTMSSKKKNKRTHNDVKTLYRNLQIEQKPGMNSCAPKDKQFGCHLCYLSCYPCYKPSDKSSIREGSDYDYNKRNIIVVIWDSDIPYY